MEKVKEVVNKIVHPGDKHADTTHNTHTTGTTHSSGVIGTTHGTGVTSSSGTAGPHSSNIANKADPRVDSDLDGSRNAGAAQYGAGAHNNNHGNTGLTGQYDTAGPHSSNLANKTDPRVDSDLDGSRNAGAATYGAGAHNQGSGFGTGNAGTHSTSTTAGPHSSNLANKLDPRVDSDRDGSRNAGAAQYGPGAHQSNTTGSGLTGTHGSSGLTGTHGSSGLTGNTHGTSGHSTNAGPHSSNIANSVDPRVDSDRDGSRNMGAANYGPGGHVNQHSSGLTENYGTTGSGLTGSHGTTGSGLTGSHGTTGSGLTGSHGTTGSGLIGTHGNKGSGLTGSHVTHGVGGIGSGPAPNTAGPHSSDLMNKLDPRTDSDRDGSKTIGKEPTPQY